MLAQLQRHVVFTRSLAWTRLRRLETQCTREDDPQIKAMASNEQSYKEWSHESLIERVSLLEQQLKDQTER